MKTLKMALRNLRRNLRRSLITGIAIAFGMALLIFSSGFGDGAHGAMIEKGVASLAGHVVIQGEGWQEKRENDIVVPNSAAVAQQLREPIRQPRVVVQCKQLSERHRPLVFMRSKGLCGECR